MVHRMLQNKAKPVFDENYQYFQPVARAGRFSVPWWSAFFYARLVRRYARPTMPPIRVFEIGCNFGLVLAHLERDYETYGVDISEYALPSALIHTLFHRWLLWPNRHNVALIAMLLRRGYENDCPTFGSCVFVIAERRD